MVVYLQESGCPGWSTKVRTRGASCAGASAGHRFSTQYMRGEIAADVAKDITRRQWYDLPGATDLYSDGSSVRGPSAAKVEGKVISVQTALAIDRSLGSRTTKIASNPLAGELRRHELDGVWLRRTLEIQRTENAKALALAQLKRETNLAKQTVAGLRTLGLHHDVTALAIIFRLAYQHANDRTCAEAQKPEVQQALAVLDAALRFDSRGAAAALGLTVQRRKTFGYAGSSVGSLSGSSKV